MGPVVALCLTCLVVGLLGGAILGSFFTAGYYKKQTGLGTKPPTAP